MAVKRERRLTGGKAIADFLGFVPARISKWRAQYDDIPIVKNKEGKLEANATALRIWALRNGKVEPRNTKEIRLARGVDEAEADPELEPKAPEPPRAPPADPDDLELGLGRFLDPERFASRREPTGDIADEIASARELRHLLERIVHSWRVEHIGDVKEARTFRDFAAENVRVIAAIGRLEESLVKQAMRNGRLLDETSVQALTGGIAAAVIGQFRGLARTIFDLFSAELRRSTDELELDISFDSDRVLKLLDRLFDGARLEIAKTVPGAVAEARRGQMDRLGGDEDEDEEELEE